MQLQHAELAPRIRAHVRAIVKRRDVTLTEIAARTGYTEAHLSNVLAGRRSMRPELAEALTRATGATLADLFGDAELRSIEKWMAAQCDRSRDVWAAVGIQDPAASPAGAVTKRPRTAEPLKAMRAG